MVVGTILAIAVWGSFQSNGYYRSQPATGKVALMTVLTLGSAMVLFFVVGYLTSLLLSNERGFTYYQMTKSGTIYKVSQRPRGQVEIVDLNGVALKDPKTGRSIDRTEFNKLVAISYAAGVTFDRKHRPTNHFRSNARFYSIWQANSETLWYRTRQGRLVAYDVATRRLTGTLEPPGYEKGESERFSMANGYYYYNPWQLSRVLATATTVYQVDVENRALKPLITVTNEDGIGAAQDVSTEDALVVTRSWIYLLDPEGKPLWKVPYKPGYPQYPSITVHILDRPGQYALWMNPDYSLGQRTGSNLLTKVILLGEGAGVGRTDPLSSFDLPALPPSSGDDTEGKIMSVMAPPVLYSLAFMVQGHHVWPMLRKFLPITLTAAVVCVLVGLWLNRRHHASAGSQFGWVIFHLLFGVPGLAAFVCAQEWPAREPCPNCRKPRAVDREQCEHCGANFGPAEKNGTEIFEPLTTT